MCFIGCVISTIPYTYTYIHIRSHYGNKCENLTTILDKI